MNLLDYIGKEDQITHENKGDVKAIHHFEGRGYPIMVVFPDVGTNTYTYDGRCFADSSHRSFKIKPKPKKTWYKLAWYSSPSGCRIVPDSWHPNETQALCIDRDRARPKGPILEKTDWEGEE